MKRLALVAALAVPVVLGGCQTIKTHNPFRHRTPDYQVAQEERPLEVPPGLNQPATTEALAIPGENAGGASQAASTAATAAVPPALAPTEAAGAATVTRTLTLADTVDNAYRRIGLALARGDVGEVTAHDDSAHTYTVAVDTTVTEKPAGGFLRRLFHRSHKQTVRGEANVSVAAEGAGSVVTATGSTAAVEQVMQVLHTRLK
ncbi:MAG TPA: hypothetical protein VFQ95_01260 [Rhodanobacteraceae bacterium]|nr:hypothetical protein [Rhodanobacteraceae bacterium]